MFKVMLYEKDLKDFTDAYGFIGHGTDKFYELEFGDSAQRTYMNLLFKISEIERISFERFSKSSCEDVASFRVEILNAGEFVEYKELIKQSDLIDSLMYNDNEPVRHWDKSKWWGQKGTMSRDNSFPKLCFDSVCNKKAFLKFTKLLFKRCFFFWNTKNIWESTPKKFPIPDLAGPKTMLVIMRGFMNHYNLVILWPLLVMLDVVLIPIILIKLISAIYDRPNTSGDLNTTCAFLLYKILFPTPFSYLARKLYSYRCHAGDEKFRKSLYKKENGIVSAFKYYFRHDSAPPLDVVAKKVIENNF